jgi:hypothetical protein
VLHKFIFFVSARVLCLQGFCVCKDIHQNFFDNVISNGLIELNFNLLLFFKFRVCYTVGV